MIKQLAVGLAMIVALSTAACGRVETFRYALSRPGALPPSSPPAVYMEGQGPGGAVQELAMVEAVGYGNKADMGDVIHALQDEGAKWGANAVVRVRVDCGYGSCHGWGVAVRLPQ